MGRIKASFSPGDRRPAQTFWRWLAGQLWLVCDAMVTASTRAPTSRRILVRTVFGRRTSRYERFAAAFNLVDAIVPGVARAWIRLALRTEKLSFRCAALMPVGFGTGDTVFSLRGDPGRSVVCKVERRSLGRPAAELFAMALWRTTAFHQIRRDYEGLRDVFPDAQFLVAHGPMLGVPAVVTLQTLVHGPLRDLLRTVDVDEIRDLAARDPRLRAQITEFLDRTIAAWERGGWIVDLGRDNLVLAGAGDDTRLVYLDVEMKEIATLRGTYREKMYESLVERMRAIVESLGSLQPREDVTKPAPTASGL